MLSHARHDRRGQRALIRDRVLRVLVTDLVAARTAAGMTQQAVAMRMWTTKSAVSRLESGRYARPTLDTVEKYALAVGARVEIRVRSGWQGHCAPARTMAPTNDRFRGTNRSAASGRNAAHTRNAQISTMSYCSCV
jgi:transcriptional regulator with XRE-family HTH domain